MKLFNKQKRTKCVQLVLVLALLFVGQTGFTMPHGKTAIVEFEAFRQYSMRPESELSKLIYLMDWFKDAEVRIRYNGMDWDSIGAAREGKKLLKKSYRKEKAEDWVKFYTYRSPDGEVITAKFPTGDKQELRQVFLKELDKLEKITKIA